MSDLLSRTHAIALDAADPLRPLRNEFLIPRHGGGEQTYFVGNSLGLQPRGAQAAVQEVMKQWGIWRWKATSPVLPSGCPTTAW